MEILVTGMAFPFPLILFMELSIPFGTTGTVNTTWAKRELPIAIFVTHTGTMGSKGTLATVIRTTHGNSY
jgi:hypothetical protein